MISNGRSSYSREDILKQVSEADIIGYYLGINSLPTLIHSPFRKDKNPSFSIYCLDSSGKEVNYKDFSTNESGGCMSLLSKLWNMNRSEVYNKIMKDISHMRTIDCKSGNYIPRVSIDSKKILESRRRDWQQYDIDFWASYGIPLEILQWAEVYPISHKIITTNGQRGIFNADKYAYTFIERKEGRITQKFYQPFNKEGFKWQNSHDKSVLGLWTKMPQKGKAVCICSSVKDALCLIANLHIPCICVQGEGYPVSDTAVSVLRSRFTDIFVCLDNDETGLRDANKLATQHGFINVVIPPFEGGKDISDYYKANGKEVFIALFTKLFKEAYDDFYNELPF